MAVFVDLRVKNNRTDDELKRILDYVQDDRKTVVDGEKLVSGINCNYLTAYDEFLDVYHKYHKKNGDIKYYQFVQSLHDDDKITPHDAHEMAKELMNFFDGYQIVVATHKGTTHLHSHFIMNPVNIHNGERIKMNSYNMMDIRHLNDKLCEKYHVFVDSSDFYDGLIPITEYEYNHIMKGDSWKMNMCKAMDDVMRKAMDIQQFITMMSEHGYIACYTETRRNISIMDLKGHRCRDVKFHHRKYLKENVENEFKIRENIIMDGINNGIQFKFDSEELRKRYSSKDVEGVLRERKVVDNGNEKITRTGWEFEREIFLSYIFKSEDLRKMAEKNKYCTHLEFDDDWDSITFVPVKVKINMHEEPISGGPLDYKNKDNVFQIG